MNSTGRRVTAFILVLLIAALLIDTCFQMVVRKYLRQQYLDRLEENGNAITALADAYTQEEGLFSRAFFRDVAISSRVAGTETVLCSADGTVLLCSDSPLGCQHQGLTIQDPLFLQRIFSGKPVRTVGQIPTLYPETRYLVALPILSGNQPAGIVLVSTPISGTAQVLNRLSRIALVVCLAMVLVVILLMGWTNHRVNNPLRILARTASRFGHGELDARVTVPANAPPEVQEVATAFNNMARSLQKSEDQRQEFVANVSHELKTPMTTIGGYVDGMLDGTIPPEKHRHYMQLVSDETKRLSRLVRSMLDISRLQDQGGISEEKKLRFEVAECVGQALISFVQKITEKALQVQVDFPAHPVYTLAAQDAITQVVYNLLDNAVKFCPREGTLEVSVKAAGSKVYVSVTNEGDTIPPEELPFVFERFHKLDKSRSRNRDGWGLGLYIVKTIIGSHGENISVTSRQGKTRFTFTLPSVM